MVNNSSAEKSLNQLIAGLELSDKEQAVFEILIGRGSQPASRIAKSLSLPRNTTRNILDRLVDQGFVARGKKANSHLYRVESVNALQRNLEERQRNSQSKFKRQAQVLKQLEPFISKAGDPSKKPSVAFYEGLDGMERVYEDTLTSKEEIRAWASFDANSKALPEYFRSYYKRRAAKKIAIRSIHPDTALSRVRHAADKKERRTSVLVPESLFSITPEIQVYDNKINLVSWNDKIGVLIESEELATALKNIFELSFSLAKKNSREK